MYVLIEPSELVATGFASSLGREGVPLARFLPEEFLDWVSAAPTEDLRSVEAFLVGGCQEPESLSKAIRSRSPAPVIAMPDQNSLERTLALFEAGADDVVRKPVHAREILARVEAVRRRERAETKGCEIGRLKVFFDGRSPEVDGVELALPRRERRILEILAAQRGRWLTKAQVFSATYGLFDEKVQESVVESHVSKLRRKLAAALGEDPIESRRFLGYRLA
jgi:DNA-binding response OmpR family regulator